MIKSRWFFHPLFIFIFSLMALASSLVIYIRSYLRVNAVLHEVILKYNLNSKQLLDTETWVIVLALSLLVAVILAGLLIIYIYYQKMIQLYRLQQNFINGFTHELKTPIASLKLFLDTFSRFELPREEQMKYLDFMKEDTKRLSDNVNRILHLGKLEDKNFKANFREHDLVLLIENFLQSTPHLFEDVKIEFKTELKSCFMSLDIELFEMLLMNLITNGVTYNNSSHKELLLKLYKVKSKIILEIKDNGIGIEKDELDKIFRKFYQVGKTSKGSGLGLYIVQSIVKLHKGEVEAFSDGKNKGTTFKLWF